MKGFILAAGLGERLRPLTDEMPKPLVPVLNLPAICYSLILLKEAGIKDIIINLHYRQEDIRTFFARHRDFGCRITFSFEEEILGTGGGLKNCEALLGDSPFVLLNSDVIMDLDLTGVLNLFLAKSPPGLLVLQERADAAEIGPVALREDRIADFKNFLKTGIPGRCIYTGGAVLSPMIFPYLTEEFSSVVYTGYVDLIRTHRLDFCLHKGRWFDIGGLRSCWESSMALLKDFGFWQSRAGEYLGMEMNPVHPQASLGKGVVVDQSVVGEGSVVGGGSRIEKTLLFPGSRVGRGVCLRNCIVMGTQVFDLTKDPPTISALPS